MKDALPLYEYRCTSCSHRFDKIQKFNDEPETTCPKCGGELERPLSAPAFQFKGGGWYVSDYAAKPAASSSTDKPASESAPASAESKSESKPSESKPATDSKSTATSDSSSKPASTSGAS